MKTFSARELQDFLLAVVNDLPSVMTKYGNWLPPSDGRAVDFDYMVRPWEGAMRPICASPKDLPRLYVATQRHKLRLVWNKALGLSVPEAFCEENAQSMVRQMSDETRIIKPKHNVLYAFVGAELWLRKTKQALEWLYENTDKLRRCGIEECKVYPYFIVSAKHKKFCSDTCKEHAEIARGVERAKEQAAARGSKGEKHRISPEGKIEIAKAQRARWAKVRKAAKKGAE
jgi:hypothetical protein